MNSSYNCRCYLILNKKKKSFRTSSKWLREPDLNWRPSGYEPDELPGCSIPRYLFSCFVFYPVAACTRLTSRRKIFNLSPRQSIPRYLVCLIILLSAEIKKSSLTLFLCNIAKNFITVFLVNTYRNAFYESYPNKLLYKFL